MNTSWLIFAGVLILNAIAALTIAISLLRRPQVPGLRSMAYMLIGLGLWSFCYAMITLSPSLEAKHFWIKLENAGIVSVPVLWFFFTFKYTRWDKWLTRPVMVLFWVVPLITIVLLFSGQWFNLYYSFARPVSEPLGPLTIGRGPWYLVQLIQSYTLNLIGMGVLIWRFIQSPHIYRRQMLPLIAAIIIPFIFNIIYQLMPGLDPFFTVRVDLTPLSFNLTAILLATSIFGLRLFDLMPIARASVLEHIPEMVFVLDSYDRILDANSMAQKWLGKTINEIVGRDPMDVFHEWPQLINRLLSTEQTLEEIVIPGHPSHTLELVITPLFNRLNVLEGRVIVAHDVTERTTMENELKKANESLKIQLTEIESLRAKLLEQAIRDPLTGVFNRRFFAESLDKEVARATRDHVTFSVVIMDVDHFKQFNDTFGHKCGDVVLQALARFLNDNTRRGDIVCRYGGEEFVILMPDATLDSGYERTETWRSNFESTILEYGGQHLSVTFSAGVACFPLHGSTGDEVLNSADQALYQSKTNGRNRVTIYNFDKYLQ